MYVTFIIQKWLENGVGQKWKPMWRYCHPCLESMEPTSVIRLENINEDKDYVFSSVGVEYTFFWENSYDTNEETAINEKIQKK